MATARIKGAREGCCNICGQFSQLTWDHVPPQGCITPAKAKVRNLTEALVAPAGRFALLQNGMKFRTLGECCNSNLLGHYYDPALNHFARKVAQILRLTEYHRIRLPNVISVTVEPLKIARSIIGHLLAIDVRQDMATPPRTAPMPDAMRDFVLHPAASLPPELSIYW